MYLEYFRRELSKYIFPLLLFTLCVYLFAPTLTIPLLSDDYLWVKNVARFESFTDFVANHFALKETDFRYRPLMPTGVRLCYQISGTDPFCAHLVGFTLQFFNTLLLGNLAYVLTKNKWAAWAAMFFFAVYFPRVVTVVWMSDLGNLLAVFFMLLTTILFLKFTKQKKYLWWGLSLITFSLAMISKESALALGPILIIWGGIFFWKEADTFNRKLIVMSCSGYIILAIIYVFIINRTGLNFAFHGTGDYTFHFDLNAIRNVVYYPLNFIWPTKVSLLEIAYQNLYDISRTHSGNLVELLSKISTVPGIYWIVGGMLCILLSVLWLIWQHQTTNWLALVWIILGILPVIFLAGHGERHLYVASIGLSLLIGSVFFQGIGKQSDYYNLKTFFITLLFVIILALNIRWSQERVQDWQTAGSIAKQMISTVTTSTPDLPEGAEIWVANLPLDYNNAYIFRLGFEAALQQETNDPSLKVYPVPQPDNLPSSYTSKQFAFIFSENQLVNVTPNYRSD